MRPCSPPRSIFRAQVLCQTLQLLCIPCTLAWEFWIPDLKPAGLQAGLSPESWRYRALHLYGKLIYSEPSLHLPCSVICVPLCSYGNLGGGGGCVCAVGLIYACLLGSIRFFWLSNLSLKSMRVWFCPFAMLKKDLSLAQNHVGRCHF